MTQQLPPPPTGFTAQSASAQQVPPPPQGFSAQPVQQQAPAQPDQQSFMDRFRAGGEELSQKQAQAGAESTIGMIGNPTQQKGLAAAIQSTSPVLGKIASSILGLGNRTMETEVAPELTQADSKKLGFEISYNLATNFNTDEIEQVVRKQLGDNAVRKDELGNTFVNVNGKEFIINRPGFSAQDREVAMNDFIAFLPSSSLAVLATSTLAKLGVAGIASGVTQAIIEGGQAATGADFSLGEVGLAAATGPLGEIPGAISAARKLTPAAAQLLPDVTDAEAAMARSFREKTGVSLLPSQASDSQKDELVNFMLLKDPQTSKKMGARLKEQSKETYSGLIDFLDVLATSDEAAGAALDVRNMSKAAIKASEDARDATVKPLYQKVWQTSKENKVVIDTTDVIYSVKNMALNAIGKNAIVESKEIVAMIERASRKVSGSNVQKIHDLKRALYQKRDALKIKEGILDKETKDIYKNAWEMVHDKLFKEVEGYEAANNLYMELSPAVDALKEQTIGDVANIPEKKLADVSRKIFNLAEFNANEPGFRQTKDIIQNANSDSWNALVRAKFKQDLAEIGVSSVKEFADTGENFTQQLFSKSFKGGEKTLFKASLDGDMRKNYVAMAEIFSKTRKRPAQSATAQLQNLERKVRGDKGMGAALDSIFNPSASGIFQKVFGSPQVKERNMAILADIITDPKWMDRMSEIRRLGMGTPPGGAAFVQLWRDALSQSEEASNDSN